ncbi:hypothetical protein K502DRAFT_354138 [Neoconidiobolus thromboides FSU 785]|nr:hypothetical protein K502DRAFT_354138 [Neoconidiobolus thromboides FSU 785]
MICSKYFNDLRDKAAARSTFFKYIPNNFKNPARKTDLCNICAVKYRFVSPMRKSIPRS